MSTGSRADIERAIAHVRTVLAAMPADAPENAEVRGVPRSSASTV